MASIWSGGQALLGVLSLLVITPVVAFYLLHYWDLDDRPRRPLAAAPACAGHPRPRRADEPRHLRLVRGQGLLCLILGIFYAAALSAIGLNFGLLIGLGAGLLSFIPFVGTAVGFIASVGVAAIQFPPEWLWVAITAAIFVFGQFLEGYILQPRLLGNSVGLHPVWLMFALFAFSLLSNFRRHADRGAGGGDGRRFLVRFALNQYLVEPLLRRKPAAAGGKRRARPPQ